MTSGRKDFTISAVESLRLYCLCLSMVCLSTPAFAESCSLYDTTYYCDNGDIYSQYGDVTYDNHGNSWSQYGSTSYGTNGSMYSRYGDNVYDRHGNAWSTYGDTTYTPDGDACSRYGNTIYCQKTQQLMPLIAR